jgi:hypothetical protein
MILGIILLFKNHMKRKVYDRWIRVRKGKSENGLDRRDWPERGFGKFMSTANLNEF